MTSPPGDIDPDGSAAQPEAASPRFLSRWLRRRDGLITWSSGTTGDPKGVVRSGWAVLENLAATAERLRYHAADVFLPLLPVSHQYGLSLVLLAYRQRTGLVLAPSDRLGAALRLGAAAGATVVDAAPSTYHALLAVADRQPQLLDELSTVRMWCVGGAPLDPVLAARFTQRVGRPLLDGYGSTEAGNVALSSIEDPVACGRPLRGVRVRVVDRAGGEMQPGALGEVEVKASTMFSGYLGEDGITRPRTPGWFPTGDLGCLDAAGRLTVVGRHQAVHCLGHTVYPEAVGRRAADALGAPVEVVALDDERRGSQLVFVVAAPAREDWRQQLAQVLPPHERPVRIVPVPSLPLGPTGKPDRRRLHELTLSAIHPVRRAAAGAAASSVLARRVEALRAVRDAVAADPAPVMDILTEVATARSARLELAAFLRTLDGAVAEVAEHRPQRVGRVAVHLSSNILLYSTALHLLVPCLFADRVVFRPSSHTHDQTRRLHELLRAIHELPVELVATSQRRFVDEEARVAEVCVFTGSFENAEQVRKQLRPDQLFLFFGHGVNPFVIAPDADVERAVADAIRVRLLNSGQDCLAPDVHFVHRSLADRFLYRLVDALMQARLGPNSDPDADYGPLFYEGSIEASADYLRVNRHRIVHGGRIDFRNRVVEPSVVLADLDERLAITEVYAPVFTVVRYDDPAALRGHLATPFFRDRALGATVHGVAPDLVADLRRHHTVSIDRTLLEVEDGNRPFGGWGIQANYVAHRGRRRTGPLLVSQAVAAHLGRRP